MKGIVIETVYDYSVGPGPRVKMTIDCNEFNPEHGWGNDFESCPELDALLQSHIDTTRALNSPNVSIVLNNYKIDADTANIDLYWLYKYLEKFDVQSIWTYTTYDFIELLKCEDFDFVWVLSGYDNKAKKYFVCGIPDKKSTFIEIPGQVLDKFPVKPFYRQAFNQRIWEIDENIYKDVTNEIDPYYKLWKHQK